ncbi:hypothetical protein [Dictyobacter kobayashii]|uniref:Uncharacterized protein n=1 Tax=Dictyobacter kobayashii TaxID=2014872 RepID=A0A402AD21_9CHLR|nr:hypothetical protein [Dictyobacter kobayashii]GCE16984.1 hypothetical protein KDK_07840 [Dictyobacter kobayashii]
MNNTDQQEIIRPVRSEYKTLVETIALSVGVTADNISELLESNEQLTRASTLIKGKPCTVKLNIEKDYPISLDSKKLGRVFELSGQSDRNKTTSLIYLATILGINWDETRPFLDKDDKVFHTASRIVVPSLARSQKANLRLTSTGFDLAISIAEGKATILLQDEKGQALPDCDNRVVSLASSEDWQEYRRLMAFICDVQFVGKSRDFIGQVSIEESKDLGNFCSYIATNKIAIKLSSLRNLPRDQVYGRTEKDLAQEISILTNRSTGLQKEIDGFNNEITNFQQLILSSQELISTYRKLEEIQTPDLAEVLHCLKREEMVRDQDKERENLEKNIINVENDLMIVQDDLAQVEPLFNKIIFDLDALKSKIANELKNLSALSGYAAQVLSGIAAKNYDALLAFCSYAQVDDEVINLLDGILKASKEFSKGLVIPIKTLDDNRIKLVELEQSWSEARLIALDIQRLNPELKNAYSAFNAAGLSSGQDVHKLESSVETIQLRIKDKERLLKEFTNNLKIIKETIQSLLGSENLLELKERRVQYTQLLLPNQKDLLERVEQLSEAVGFTDPWQLNLSELQDFIREWSNKIQLLENSKAEKEETERIVRNHLIEMKRSSPRNDTGRLQIDALIDLQKILLLISNYLNEYRRKRERGQEESKLYTSAQFEQLKEQLGKNGKEVHQTLNRVIRKRCPVMYKNRAPGQKKIPVHDYDFLTGEQVVPDLQMGEWAGGGGDSAMTVFGLATKSSGSYIGTILLVDEFNDAETFKDTVCEDLAVLEHLAFAIFVNQDPEAFAVSFEVIK